MQQLNELPKADKFFKQIVDKKVESYIETSSKVADEFIKQSQEAKSKAVINQKYLQDLRQQLAILKAVQLTKVEGSGISLSEVKEMILKYEDLIRKIEEKIQVKIQEKFKETDENQFLNDQINMSFELPLRQMDSKSSIQEEGLISRHFDSNQSTQSNNSDQVRNLIKWSLKSLQFVTVSLMILCLIKVLFMV